MIYNYDNFNIFSGNINFLWGSRGIVGGGYAGGTIRNSIEYINISTNNNAIDFGDLQKPISDIMGTSNGTIGLFIGGNAQSGGVNVYLFDISFINISINSNAVIFSTLSQQRDATDCGNTSSNGIYAFVFGGNYDWINPTYYFTSKIEKIHFFIGNTIVNGFTLIKNCYTSCSNGIYSINQPERFNSIEIYNMWTDVNTSSFNSSFTNISNGAAISNGIKGIFAGSGGAASNIIEYVHFSIKNYMFDFGDYNGTAYGFTGVGNGYKGLFCGGRTADWGSYLNYIHSINTYSNGNSTDMADLTETKTRAAGFSGS